jgi:hypothetical protein
MADRCRQAGMIFYFSELSFSEKSQSSPLPGGKHLLLKSRLSVMSSSLLLKISKNPFVVKQ